MPFLVSHVVSCEIYLLIKLFFYIKETWSVFIFM